MTAGLRLADFHPRRRIRRPETVVDRPAHPVVDAHNHLGRWLSSWVGRDGDWVVPDVGRLLDDLDEVGVQHVVNLDGRFGDELEQNLCRYDEAHPDRFSTFCHVDWRLLSEGRRASGLLVDQLVTSVARGAKGWKVWKDLGLHVRDDRGELLMPDAELLRPLFDAAGELGIPVLIHVADPIAFFDPVDARNERIDDLTARPEWAVGPPRTPGFDALIDSLEALVARHPDTGFIGAHVGCAAEDLDRVASMLDRYPHYAVDLGARISELGRTPRRARALIVEHPDQVVFGTDSFPPSPTEYRRWYRFLETDDECFAYGDEHEAPGSGRWDISALDLPGDVLERLYGGTARRLLPHITAS